MRAGGVAGAKYSIAMSVRKTELNVNKKLFFSKHDDELDFVSESMEY